MDVQKYFSSFHIIYCIFTQRMTKACVCLSLSLVLSLSSLVYKQILFIDDPFICTW